MSALGMLEVRGFVGAVEVADTMAKVANISILEVKKTNGQGWMTVFIEGDVAAVQSAIQAGSVKAKEREFFVAAKVIPRPATDVKEVLVSPKNENKQKVEPPIVMKVEPVAEQIVSEIKENEIEIAKDIEKAPTEAQGNDEKQPVQKEKKASLKVTEQIKVPELKTTNSKAAPKNGAKKNENTEKQSESGKLQKK